MGCDPMGPETASTATSCPFEEASQSRPRPAPARSRRPSPRSAVSLAHLAVLAVYGSELAGHVHHEQRHRRQPKAFASL